MHLFEGDVIGHVTIRLPVSTSYGWSIVTKRLSGTVTALRRYGASNIGCTDVDTERKMEEGKEKEEEGGEGTGKWKGKRKGKGMEKMNGR